MVGQMTCGPVAKFPNTLRCLNKAERMSVLIGVPLMYPRFCPHTIKQLMAGLVMPCRHDKS